MKYSKSVKSTSLVASTGWAETVAEGGEQHGLVVSIVSPPQNKQTYQALRVHTCKVYDQVGLLTTSPPPYKIEHSVTLTMDKTWKVLLSTYFLR